MNVMDKKVWKWAEKEHFKLSSHNG